MLRRTEEHVSAPLRLPVTRSRWLHVVTHLDPKYGGLSSAVPALGEALIQRAGCRAEIAAFCADGEYFRPAGFEGEHVSFWPQGRGTWLHNHQLRSRFEAEVAKADGLHIHGLWEQSTLEACHAALAAKKPYVLSAHGMLEPWALGNKRLKKLIYAALLERRNVRGAACRIGLTKAEIADYRRFGAMGPAAIIPNGVSVPEFADPEPFYTAYPELRGRRIVLFLGRLHHKKGVDMLVKSWTGVARQFPDGHLVMAGPDAEGTKAALEEMARGSGVRDRVTFTGMLQDGMKWSALAAAEGFVLPSHSEGLPISVLEAMGVGKPVIVTYQCNIPEVQTYGAGWTIQPDGSELEAGLCELLRNSPARNAEIGACGARVVEERFNWDAVARKTAEVYRWVLGGPVPRHAEVFEV